MNLIIGNSHPRGLPDFSSMQHFYSMEEEGWGGGGRGLRSSDWQAGPVNCRGYCYTQTYAYLDLRMYLYTYTVIQNLRYNMCKYNFKITMREKGFLDG